MKYPNNDDTIPLTQRHYRQFFLPCLEDAFHLKEKTTYSINTIDNLGFDENLDKKCNFLNPLSGPFYLENARAGDILSLHIVNITPTRDVGISSQGILPNFLQGSMGKPVLGKEVIFWKIYKKHCHPIIANEILTTAFLYENPMIGCIRGASPATSPTLSSLDVDQYGGNLDCTLFKPGATIFFPSCCNHALFYLGDVHYSQADGEVGGSGIEISSRIEFSVKICKHASHRGLHVLTDKTLYFIGIDKNLSTCIKLSYTYAYNALRNTGIGDNIARIFLGHGSTLSIIKLGEPNITAVGIDQRHFPQQQEG